MAPLDYRPQTPKPPQEKRVFPEPYYPGAVVRVTSLPEEEDTHWGFRIGDTFTVLEVEPSYDPTLGLYYYEAGDNNGLWSNNLECISE